jgi:hypothetical protein
MKNIVAAFVATWSCVSYGQAPVATIATLPPPIIDALQGFCAPFSFADAGDPWQATDSIVRSSTDDKRAD